MPNAPAQAPQAAPVQVVPFVAGTYEYTEPMPAATVTLGASQQDLPPINITPGGFLRAISIIVTSTGGVIGAGVLSADGPFSIFNYITLESIDGTPIIYPMNGYSHYLAARYQRPFDNYDPALDSGSNFSATINPAFRLNLSVEGRATLGCLPNTDARAQYRLRMSMNPTTSTNPAGGLCTTAPTTPPTVTVSTALQVYAQPPRSTLTGAPIQQVPDGIAAQRFISHQFDNIGTGQNTVKLNRVGNLIRTIILVIRDTNGNRTDLTTDPIRLRVDNTQLFVVNRAVLDFNMWRWWQGVTAPGVSASSRPTGVYAIPRWQSPEKLLGVGWLETSPATFLQWEINGGPSGGNMEQIIEDVALVGPLPTYLENV